MTTTAPAAAAAERYARCIAASRRIRWDIDGDVIRGRGLDFDRKFLPDGLTRVKELPFLAPGERRFLSQVQGRTYCNMFRMIERAIGAKTLELSRGYWFDDPVASEALVRFTDEEIKHQELFRRIEELAAAGMPPGYSFRPRTGKVAATLLGKSTWAVLGLTLDFELMSLAHYRSSIEPDDELSPLWRDVFLFHWKEESQHAILDELEWSRENARLDEEARDRAVDDLVSLVEALDATVAVQAATDADYFIGAASRAFSVAECGAIHDTWLRAYRWQYIVTGMQEPRFMEALKAAVTTEQLGRVRRALAPIAAQCAP